MDGSELPRSQALLQGIVLHGRGCWRRRPDGGAIRLQTKTQNALRCDTFTTQRVSACSRRNTMQYTESFISVYLLAARLLPTQMALYEYTMQRAVVSAHRIVELVAPLRPDATKECLAHGWHAEDHRRVRRVLAPLAVHSVCVRRSKVSLRCSSTH